jgi:hypothetical protein
VVGLVVLLAISATLAIRHGGRTTVTGTPAPAAGTVGPVRQDGWTELLNPDAGLTYQIPPAGWSAMPHLGPAGTVDLAQGATTGPYTCGSPPQLYDRGILGSGSAPRSDPRTLATAIAEQAATAYYTPQGGPAPQVKPAAPTTVLVRAPSGGTVTGAVVRAVATRPAGPCVAGSGSVFVLVLALSDRDGVLVVNGDLAGGPADPPPPGQSLLRTIVGTAQPIGG